MRLVWEIRSASGSATLQSPFLSLGGHRSQEGVVPRGSCSKLGTGVRGLFGLRDTSRHTEAAIDGLYRNAPKLITRVGIQAS